MKYYKWIYIGIQYIFIKLIIVASALHKPNALLAIHIDLSSFLRQSSRCLLSLIPRGIPIWDPTWWNTWHATINLANHWYWVECIDSWVWPYSKIYSYYTFSKSHSSWELWWQMTHEVRCLVKLLPTPIVVAIISSLHLLLEWTICIVQCLVMESQVTTISHPPLPSYVVIL